MKRRSFLHHTAIGSTALSLPAWMSACQPRPQEQEGSEATETLTSMKPLQLSLAQWSLHRQIEAGELDPVDFASVARDTYGLDAVEYVNQFYVDHATDEAFWLDLKARADQAGVHSLLIMVDNEGDLGIADAAARTQAVENHYKWVDAAKLLGCHSIRVNAFGESDRAAYRSAMIESLGQLATYAAQEDLHVLIENHGLFSADAALIVDIIQQVGMPNVGTFPDFGNWCLSAQWGSTQHECEQVYDIYQGVGEFLPYAKAVSAKSYDFDEAGNQTKIDYEKMLTIVKNSNYEGYIGIEYEGEQLNEHEGVLATKALIERLWPAV